MERALRFTAGLALGALVGATVVLLLAPQSGAEVRQSIQDRFQAIVDEGRQAAEERQLELTARFEALKQPQPPA